jgi:hypothetical protein
VVSLVVLEESVSVQWESVVFTGHFMGEVVVFR